MKLLFLISLCPLLFSCQKSYDNRSHVLSLLQNKWMVVSKNGDAFSYTGKPQDYYNFTASDTLYTYVDIITDTAIYNLQNDGDTLVVYLLRNGVQNPGLNFNIDNLSGSQLIISSHSNSSANIVDSLKR